jgi:anti-anti-sigma factor
MSVSTRAVGTVAAGTPLVEVIVTEELDSQAAARLGALLDDALAMRPTNLVLDLAGCPSLGAAAIAALLDAHRRARHAGGHLTLRSPSPRVRRVLHLARVDRVLYVTPPAPPDPARTDETGHRA